jgi:hypothetical protein
VSVIVKRRGKWEKKPLRATARFEKSPPKYNTLGVRFLGGQHPERVYTYGVRKGARVHLGQLLVAETPAGPSICVAVRLDKKPSPINPEWRRGLQFITQRVVEGL